MIEANLIERLQAKARSISCVEAFGLTMLDFDAGFCRLRARHIREFDGVFPVFHGGMLAAVADCAAWFAIATLTGPDELMVTTDLNVHYLRPCEGDAFAEARVIRLGRTLRPTRVDLFNVANEFVAVATVCYMKIEPRPAE